MPKIRGVEYAHMGAFLREQDFEVPYLNGFFGAKGGGGG